MKINEHKFAIAYTLYTIGFFLGALVEPLGLFLLIFGGLVLVVLSEQANGEEDEHQ